MRAPDVLWSASPKREFTGALYANAQPASRSRARTRFSATALTKGVAYCPTAEPGIVGRSKGNETPAYRALTAVRPLKGGASVSRGGA
jgi:hypothetical protein